MPRYDAHHEIVKTALRRDGWTVTDDPLVLEYKDMTLFADLGAERTLAAEKGEEKVAVEVKVFGSPSLTTDLQKAIGQYDLYQFLLSQIDPTRTLFLAVVIEVWEDYFSRPSVQDYLAHRKVNFLIFNATTEEIVQWIR